MSSDSLKPTNLSRDPDFIGAEAAMHRAAKRARQRAVEAARVKDPTPEKSDGNKTPRAGHSPRELSFSQAEGYEELPDILKLGELPAEARTRIWNVLHRYIDKDLQYHPEYVWLDGDWAEIMKDLHADYLGLPLEKWDSEYNTARPDLQQEILQKPFNKVFDLILYVMRHDKCPNGLVKDMQRQFAKARIAYVIVKDPLAIVPVTTTADGKAVVESITLLKQTGLNACAAHLRNASECINREDWAGSIRDSIHAVESVTRQLDPKGARTLGPALASFEQRKQLHPALKEAFNKLYAYTSDQQGIRHALLDREAAEVGMDEAVFMLGACASFAGYMSRKHSALSEDENS